MGQGNVLTGACHSVHRGRVHPVYTLLDVPPGYVTFNEYTPLDAPSLEAPTPNAPTPWLDLLIWMEPLEVCHPY